MNYASRRQKQDRQIMQENVGYAEGSIRQYLNIKRTAKDRCCLAFFGIYAGIVVVLAGIGFFYGHFTQIGNFLALGTPCSQFLSYNPTTNTYACDLVGCSPPTTYGFLQRVCVTSSYEVNDSALTSQISIYNFNATLPLMVYMNIGVIIGFILLFSLLICYQKLLYLYIFAAFALLLSFAFYLLKSIKDRVDSLTAEYSSDTSLPESAFIANEQSMQPLAFILLAVFLILFPMIMFAPGKIKTGINLLSKMYSYFEQCYTVIIASFTYVLIIYGLIFLLGFLLLNFLTGGTVVTSNHSFFYLYQQISLDHPAVLVLFFIGVYWLILTLGTYHQYMISSSVMQWYFQDGGKFAPLKKGLKRGYYNIGSAALGSFLMPVEWTILLLYSICKMDSETVEQYQNEHPEDCLCLSNSLYRFRQLITKVYIKMNRCCPVSGTLTNNAYIESCELAAVTFAERRHRFFNIGGSLTLFISLFTALLTLAINYFAIYYQNYNVFPSKISSLNLQIVLAIFLGLAIGHIFSNIFGTSVDALLFCFLMEKKGGQSVSEKEVKKVMEQMYSAEDEIQEVHQMYEVQSDTE